MRLQCAGTFCAHSFNSRDFFILFRQMETNFPSHCTIIHYVHLIYLLKFGFSSVSLFAMSDICFFFTVSSCHNKILVAKTQNFLFLLLHKKVAKKQGTFMVKKSFEVCLTENYYSFVSSLA